MPVDYVGPVHANALDLGEAEGVDSPSIRGDFRGQEVRLNPHSKSLVEEADELDNYIVVRRKDPPKLKTRKISDRKKINGKNRLLFQYVRRLDKQQGSRQYQDFEARLRRLGQRATIQMMEHNLYSSSSEEDRLSFDGRDLADMVLEEAAETFSELTEQDNAVEYMEALVDFEAECAEAEARQASKMLMRLEGRTDKRGLDRQKDFQDRLRDLSAQAKVSKLFKKELALAKAALRSAHGQEIEDGYNLIPKATDLFASFAGQKAKDFENTEARQVSRLYQQALCASSLAELMEISFSGFGVKHVKAGLGAMLELSGLDIDSANPSRDVSHLIAVRETLFKTEISSQLYDAVGKLRRDIVANFSECSKKTFGESEQYAATRSLAKLSQQSFVSSSQMHDILGLFGVDVVEV
ncbi:MAG: hypothetical protein LBD33_01395 [Puniceicoccales bacterium]|jgi:hypothetical protein|nr:hypothetical protein [Puniceicoccales bacterium]